MVSRIDALIEVAEDKTRQQEEREAALLALKDIAAHAPTGHERSTAAHIIKTLETASTPVSDSEIPLSDDWLRLLYLADARDTVENNRRARLAYWQWELTKSDLSDERREIALGKIEELEAHNES